MALTATIDPDQGSRPSRSARRGDRFGARHVLWRESSLKRVRKCGHTATGGDVALVASGAGADRRAGYSGLQSCGSTWACPVCSAKIATVRALELGAGIGRWTDAGHDVLLITLTMRHNSRQALADLWAAQSAAWGAVTSGKAWVAERAAHDVAGFARVVETTRGDAFGWHVHVHALLFLRGGGDLGLLDPLDLGPVMFQRWRDKLVSLGLAAPLAGHGGLDIRRVGREGAGRLGDYFTKGSTYGPREQLDPTGAGFEVAAGQMKAGRAGNRTPFAILADVVRLGQVDDLALWHEWEAASHGRRQLTWSRGMRDLLLVDAPEATDQEIVDEAPGGEPVVLLTDWRDVCRRRLDHVLLVAAEQDDTGAALRAVLDGYAVPWRLPGAGP